MFTFLFYSPNLNVINYLQSEQPESGSNFRLSRDELLLSSETRNLDDPALDETVDLPAELPPPPDGGWGKWSI